MGRQGWPSATATILATTRWPRAVPFLLGLLLASKQYMVVIIPLVPLIIGYTVFVYWLFRGKVRAGHFVVIRYEGPKGGPGMREMLAVTGRIEKGYRAYGAELDSERHHFDSVDPERPPARLLHRLGRPDHEVATRGGLTRAPAQRQRSACPSRVVYSFALVLVGMPELTCTPPLSDVPV